MDNQHAINANINYKWAIFNNYIKFPEGSIAISTVNPWAELGSPWAILQGMYSHRLKDFQLNQGVLGLNTDKNWNPQFSISQKDRHFPGFHWFHLLRRLLPQNWTSKHKVYARMTLSGLHFILQYLLYYECHWGTLFDIAIENGPVEIADFAVDGMVDFSIVMLPSGKQT